MKAIRKMCHTRNACAFGIKQIMTIFTIQKSVQYAKLIKTITFKLKTAKIRECIMGMNIILLDISDVHHKNIPI